MSEIKTTYVCGWNFEATFGNNGHGDFTAMIAGDTAYLFGDYPDSPICSIIPEMSQSLIWRLDSRDYVALGQGKLLIKSKLQFGLMDGIPFYFTLGKTIDAGDGTPYTHAISGTDPDEDLPSFTLHYEADDPNSTSHLDKDIIANRVDKLKLSANRNEAVKIELELIGLEILDSVHLTNYPALKATAVNKVFRFGFGAWSWDNSNQDAVLAFTLLIQNNLKPQHCDRATNKHRAKYLDSFMDRIITWTLTLNLKNKTLFDEIKTNTAKTFTVTFTREVDKWGTDDDVIVITLSNSIIQSGPLHATPYNENQYTLAGIAKTCTVQVNDLIQHYNSA